jgi:hypothetical protein
MDCRSDLVKARYLLRLSAGYGRLQLLINPLGPVEPLARDYKNVGEDAITI